MDLTSTLVFTFSTYIVSCLILGSMMSSFQKQLANPNYANIGPREHFLGLTWIKSKRLYVLARALVFFVWPLYLLLLVVVGISYVIAILFDTIFGTTEWKAAHAPKQQPTPEFEHKFAVEPVARTRKGKRAARRRSRVR